MAGEAQRRLVEFRRYLLVRVGAGTRCAVPAQSVQRILRSLTVYPVPGAQPKLVGLAQYRGDPIAVLDLEVLLGGRAESSAGHGVTVVVSAGAAEASETVGLAVAEALEVATIRDIAPGGEWLVVGEAVVGDKLVRVLDLARLGAAP